MSGGKRRREYTPYGDLVNNWGAGAGYIDSIADYLDEEEQRKAVKDAQLAEAMMLFKKTSKEDELFWTQHEIRKQQWEWQKKDRGLEEDIARTQWDWKKKDREMMERQVEEQIRKEKELKERPQKAVDTFWNMMNTGVDILSERPPRFAEAISQFDHCSAMMIREIQSLAPENQHHRPFLIELWHLANAFSRICVALMEFIVGGEFKKVFDDAVGELDLAKHVLPGMQSAMKYMCEAFVDEGKRRETDFRIAVQAVSSGPQGGDMVLFLMAHVLNESEQRKYQRYFDELQRKLRP